MIERTLCRSPLLAGPLLALLGASAEASAGAHDLHVAVWGLDDTLLADARVSFARDDGPASKGSLMPDGRYLVANEEPKGRLCVDHTELGRVEFDVRLPDQAPVEVDVLFLGPGQADLILDEPGHKVRGREGFLVGAPANDLCEDAIPLGFPDFESGTTVGATSEVGLTDYCGTYIDTPGVWYSVSGTGYEMFAETCEDNTGFDTKISVFCGSCAEPVCVAGNDDDPTCAFGSSYSSVEWCSVSGQQYLILVHGFDGETGPFGLHVDTTFVECAPTVFCEPVGACCLTTGECSNALTLEGCLALDGKFQGAGTACEGEFVEYSVESGLLALIDISATGTPIVLGDDEFEAVPIGFPFFFFGEPILSVNVSSNGYLTTGPDGTELIPDPCLSPSTPNSAVFGLWHDFDPSAGGEVDHQTLGSPPGRVFIVQWTDVPEFMNPADTATFQVRFLECCGRIDTCYLELDGIPAGAGDATVGVEDATGLAGACASLSDITEGMSVLFWPEHVGPIRCDCQILHFETEGGMGSPSLVNGQDISTPPEFGIHFAIHGSGAGNLGAAVFDSDPAGPNALGPDPDLLVDRGNVLILQSADDPAQSVAGIFDRPNDSSGGGVFTFEFDSPAELRSIDLIDLDPGHDNVQILLFDVNGRTRGYWVPAGWTTDIATEGPPGFGTLDLVTLAPQPGAHGEIATCSSPSGFDPFSVLRMEIYAWGSMAIDNLFFCVSIESNPY